MRKKLEHNLKAERRDIKKRPRMKVHGSSLKRPSKHGGMALVKVKNQNVIKNAKRIILHFTLSFCILTFAF